MSEDIQAVSAASAEMQETLKELASEGHEIAGNDLKPEPKTEEPAPKAEEPASEPEPEPQKQEEPKRVEKFVPVHKHNEERHKRQEAERLAAEALRRAEEAEARMRELADKPTGDEQAELKAAATKLAEKHGLDSEFVSEFAETMVNLASKKNSIPKDLEAKLQAFEQIKQEAEAARLEAAQEQGFQKEFETIVKEFPELASQKDDLKQLAFSDGYINTPLRLLALGYLHDNRKEPGRKTVEAPVNVKRDTNDVVDFENMTDEQFRGLSDEQHALFLKWAEKRR